ncbi:MAG: hypothetical protein ACI8PG_005421, partial [Planctomycetota bacterium]
MAQAIERLGQRVVVQQDNAIFMQQPPPPIARTKKRNSHNKQGIALFTNGGGGGNRTSLPVASDHAPALQVHCATVRSDDSQAGTIA